MATLLLLGHFIASKTGKTGLTVTIDLHRIALADATSSEVVTAGACSEIGDGVYCYRYANADLATYQYVGVLKTTDATVDQQHIPVLGIVVPDELTSSRAAPADIPAAVWDELQEGHMGAGSMGEIMKTIAPVGAIADGVWTAEAINYNSTGTMGKTLIDAGGDVTLAATQGAITWGQQKIVADASNEGALDITNSSVGGCGLRAQGGDTGGLFYGSGDEATGLRASGNGMGLEAYSYMGTGLTLTGPTRVVPELALKSDTDTIHADVDAIRAKTDTGGVALSAAAVDSILDETVEGSYTLRQLLRLMSAVLLGEAAGGETTTITFKAAGNDATTRVTFTVTGAGDRTAATLNAS